jgi:hypothetical protein
MLEPISRSGFLALKADRRRLTARRAPLQPRRGAASVSPVKLGSAVFSPVKLGAAGFAPANLGAARFAAVVTFAAVKLRLQAGQGRRAHAASLRLGRCIRVWRSGGQISGNLLRKQISGSPFREQISSNPLRKQISGSPFR